MKYKDKNFTNKVTKFIKETMYDIFDYKYDIKISKDDIFAYNRNYRIFFNGFDNTINYNEVYGLIYDIEFKNSIINSNLEHDVKQIARKASKGYNLTTKFINDYFKNIYGSKIKFYSYRSTNLVKHQLSNKQNTYIKRLPIMLGHTDFNFIHTIKNNQRLSFKREINMYGTRTINYFNLIPKFIVINFGRNMNRYYLTLDPLLKFFIKEDIDDILNNNINSKYKRLYEFADVSSLKLLIDSKYTALPTSYFENIKTITEENRYSYKKLSDIITEYNFQFIDEPYINRIELVKYATPVISSL